MLKCNKCGETPENKESLIHNNHIVPKFMGGTDKEGRVPLCKKHHDILHNIIPSIIWKYVPENARADCIKEVVRFTLRYSNMKEGEPHSNKNSGEITKQ